MRAWLLIVGLLILPVAAFGQELEKIPIHSDEPLWRPGKDQVWPQQFEDQTSLSCISPLHYGVWRFARADREDDTFYLFTNYGVIHCFMNIGDGFEAGDIDPTRPGFLVKIGDLEATELWALQIGSLPGSDYLLLSRSPGPRMIERFTVLQQRCPRGKLRGGPPMDMLLTKYCAVNSQRALLAISKRMAKLPPLGTLTFEKEPPAEE